MIYDEWIPMNDTTTWIFNDNKSKESDLGISNKDSWLLKSVQQEINNIDKAVMLGC